MNLRSPRIGVLACLGLIASQSLWAAAGPESIQLMTPGTKVTVTEWVSQDSEVDTTLELPQDFVALEASVTLLGYRSSVPLPIDRFPVNSRLIKVSLPMRYGPGVYSVHISGSTGPYSGQGLVRFQLENRDPRTEMSTLLPSSLVESRDVGVEQMAQWIRQYRAPANPSAMDLIKAVHEWVAKSIAYDIENMPQYSAAKTLLERAAVCSGYARLTAALLRSLGVATRVISGNAVPEGSAGATRAGAISGNTLHAWNEAWNGERWVIIDTTWDSGYIADSVLVQGQWVRLFKKQDSSGAMTYQIFNQGRWVPIDPVRDGIDITQSKRKFFFNFRTKYLDPDPNEFLKTHTTREVLVD
jgi:transglutaminase-like putative cysteine protease